MRNILLFLVSVLFTACGNNNKTAFVKSDTTSESAVLALKVFAGNFDSLIRDSILVYPKMNSNASDEPAYPFSGKQLKAVDFKIIDSSRFEHPVNREMNFYTSYLIPMGKDHSGLLLRTPSVYWESAIYLLLWDNTLNKVADQLQVAEWWGDAGDLVFIQSWLLDLKKNNPVILVVKNITRPKDINSNSVTITTDSVYRYIIKNNRFKLEKKAETDRDYLRRKYNIILRNVAR